MFNILYIITLLISSYLALRLRTDFFTPSLLNCLNDQILPYHLLKFCGESYKGDANREDDPFISPIFMNDNVLKLLPKVRMIVGSSDPLRDDTLRFLKRLV